MAILVVIQHGLLVLPSADREFFYNLELGVERPIRNLRTAIRGATL